MFSLQDQINHKVNFIKQELQSNGPPVILVGHSIGAYQCIEVYKRLPQQYHTMRNVLFMAMTEFAQFSEEPDLSFMKKKQDQIALLYGIDDHWGPLSVFEEISKQVPGIALSLEEEGHTHAFCCTNAGSIWVARHVANLIRSRIPN